MPFLTLLVPPFQRNAKPFEVKERFRSGANFLVVAPFQCPMNKRELDAAYNLTGYTVRFCKPSGRKWFDLEVPKYV